MKKHRSLLMALAVMSAFILSACEHNVHTGSVVHTDGRIERTISLRDVSAERADHNLFGIHKDGGWDVELEPVAQTTEDANDPKVNITFKRTFASAEEANQTMDSEIDTLLRISSTFEKKNRWFYTYITYRDTYRMLNNFNFLDKNDFFAPEDFAFIERLAGEGSQMSKADSVYLDKLNEKIFDVYGAHTIFDEFYSFMMKTVRDHNVEKRWQDSLARKKDEIFHRFMEAGNLEFIPTLETMGVQLPSEVHKILSDKIQSIDRRAEFISYAYSGKYVHSISMPWDIVSSNAESVVNNQLFWRPPAIKFLLTDYTMTATSRKMNTWAVAISAVVLCLTIGLFFYRRKR